MTPFEELLTVIDRLTENEEDRFVVLENVSCKFLTDKAARLKFDDFRNYAHRIEDWIPLSQLRYLGDEVYLAKWLAEDRGWWKE